MKEKDGSLPGLGQPRGAVRFPTMLEWRATAHTFLSAEMAIDGCLGGRRARPSRRGGHSNQRTNASKQSWCGNSTEDGKDDVGRRDRYGTRVLRHRGRMALPKAPDPSALVTTSGASLLVVDGRRHRLSFAGGCHRFAQSSARKCQSRSERTTMVLPTRSQVRPSRLMKSNTSSRNTCVRLSQIVSICCARPSTACLTILQMHARRRKTLRSSCLHVSVNQNHALHSTSRPQHFFSSSRLP